MKKRLFTDSEVTPTEALLRKHLGSAMDYYTAIVAKAGDFRRQWQFSRGNGWTMKVDDMRKALFYLMPFEEGIEISLTVRDKERSEFLVNEEFKRLQVQFSEATKYSEGYALRFGIESMEQCRSVATFLAVLIKMRVPAKKG